LVFTSGTPIETAATSSSRSATQARPEPGVAQPQVDEEHHEQDAEDQPVPRPQVEQAERADAGEVRRVDRADAQVPGGQGHAAAEFDGLPVNGDHSDNLAERQRDDRDVVTAQPQRRQPDDYAGRRADRRRRDQDQQEVQVHPWQCGRHR
jgi:hypothetical protein